jgi:hypothetical protein
VRKVEGKRGPRAGDVIEIGTVPVCGRDVLDALDDADYEYSATRCAEGLVCN